MRPAPPAHEKEAVAKALLWWLRGLLLLVLLVLVDVVLRGVGSWWWWLLLCSLWLTGWRRELQVARAFSTRCSALLRRLVWPEDWMSSHTKHPFCWHRKSEPDFLRMAFCECGEVRGRDWG